VPNLSRIEVGLIEQAQRLGDRRGLMTPRHCTREYLEMIGAVLDAE